MDVMLDVMQLFGQFVPATFLNRCKEIWSILDSLLINCPGDIEICERVTRVIRKGLRLFDLSARQCMWTVLERVSNCFFATGFASYLWICGKILEWFGHVHNQAELVACKYILETSTAKVLEISRKKEPRNVPDRTSRLAEIYARSNTNCKQVIEDYLHYLMQLVKHTPVILYQSAAFATAIQVATAAMSLSHPEMTLASLSFIQNVLREDYLSRQIVDNTDQEILQNIEAFPFLLCINVTYSTL